MTNINFLKQDSLYTSEDLMIRDSVRSFVQKEVEPLLQEANRQEIFPKDLIKRFGEINLLGVNLHGYGCPGLSETAYGLIMQELEAADSGIRSFCSVQGALVMWPIYTYGSEKQKQTYLPKLASGEMVGCFGLTEADAGSNPGGMLCKAEKVSGGYKLNGSKVWITNGSIADIAIVWARLEGEVRGFIVDTKSKGFTASLMKGKFSLRVSVTSELHMEDCIVEEDAILPNAKGLKGPLSCLSQARYGIAWGVIGAASKCYQVALDYAKDRIIFAKDKPLAGYQLVQAKLVKMLQEITKAELLAIQLANLKQNQQIEPQHISLAKMNNCKMALEVAREARDILGANGIIDEYPVIRHLMNLETVNTYEGTEDIHRLVIGQAITGFAAFR